MHIGIDASRIATTARTGTERYTWELLAALAQLPALHRYTLYVNQMPPALPPLAPHMQLAAIPLPRAWTHLRLATELRLHPPDAMLIPAHVVPLLRPPRQTRTVVTLHDLGYLAFPAAHPRRRLLELHATTWWSAHAADQIIAISHATRTDLIRHYRVPDHKISVVPHGVSEQFAPVADPIEQAAVLARYGIRHTPYLLYVGTLQPRKNLARLITAFAPLAAHHPDLQLVLAGQRGWLSAPIVEQVQTLGLQRQVLLPGFVADADLPALLSGALAFVFPSLYEGFGMPVLEAMACATPVLTSSTTALPEVAGDAALLVDPLDTAALTAALHRLVSDADLRADLRQRGLARVRQFSWGACAAATLRVVSCSEE
jgi:glycosyltransferase involved in cell wall biosynthesis